MTDSDPTSDGDRSVLEELSDRAMPGADRKRLGQWVLRASRGATGRANTVWVSGRPGRPMTTACDSVERWYRDLGLVPGFQVWQGTDPSLEAELDRRHYRNAEGALVLTRQLTGRERPTEISEIDGHCESAPSPTPQFSELVADSDRLLELLDSGLPKSFVTLSDGSGRLLGGGVGALDGDQLGIFSMHTLAAARRRGVARRVLDELSSWGIARGATASWLQVMASNTPATALYSSAGFELAHEYHYRFASDP